MIQTNEEHSSGVAELAARFAGSFGMTSWGKALGELHDKGKETDAFQQHIMKESGYRPEIKVVGDYRHAYVGAVMARKLYGKGIDNLLANQILSHHTGLHDSDELNGELRKEIPQEVSNVKTQITLNQPQFCSLAKEDFHHLCRMLYSCLVDADFLDTEAFMNRESSNLRGNKPTLNALLPKLEKILERLEIHGTRIRGEYNKKQSATTMS